MNMQLAYGSNYVFSLGSADSLEPKASQLFERSYRPKHELNLRSLLGHRSSALPQIDESVVNSQLANRYDGGTHAVEVSKISGTFNKQIDFDAQFHPTQRHSENRWLRVATAFLRGVELPPVELAEVDGQYFVKDGHHRVSVARALGYRYLDANIEVWHRM
jgi:hypothetical protein